MMKSAADVEREVETSRSNLDSTLEALKDKMTPGQLFDEASRALGSTGQQVFSKFMEQAKENPMPLAVMGLGLAWLMTSSGKKQSYGYASYEPRSFETERSRYGASSAADGIGEKVSDLAAGAKSTLSDAKDRIAGVGAAVGERGRSAAHGLSSAAHSAAEKASQYGGQARQTFSRTLEGEPLLIGAIGLAVGAAIGAALPHTDLEDRKLGPLRDKALERGKDLAQGAMQQAGDVAQAAYGSVKDELANTDGGELKDRVQSAAKSAVQAARDVTQGNGNGQGDDQDQDNNQGLGETQELRNSQGLGGQGFPT
jgi:hypothetical protein